MIEEVPLESEIADFQIQAIKFIRFHEISLREITLSGFYNDVLRYGYSILITKKPYSIKDVIDNHKAGKDHVKETLKDWDELKKAVAKIAIGNLWLAIHKYVFWDCKDIINLDSYDGLPKLEELGLLIPGLIYTYADAASDYDYLDKDFFTEETERIFDKVLSEYKSKGEYEYNFLMSRKIYILLQAKNEYRDRYMIEYVGKVLDEAPSGLKQYKFIYTGALSKEELYKKLYESSIIHEDSDFDDFNKIFGAAGYYSKLRFNLTNEQISFMLELLKINHYIIDRKGLLANAGACFKNIEGKAVQNLSSAKYNMSTLRDDNLMAKRLVELIQLDK